jgi:hypothetical protein
MNNPTLLDRAVMALMNRALQGIKVPLEDAMLVCKFRSLIGGRSVVVPDVQPSAYIAVLGFAPEAFNEDMLMDALNEIVQGNVVCVMSNKRELRDHAKSEILAACKLLAGDADDTLATMTPHGSA